MKTALIIVDIQNDFIPGGALAVTGGDQIVSTINQLMSEYDLVVATQDWHPANHGSFAANHPASNVGQVIDLNGLDQVLWPTHCVEGSEGSDFVAELDTNRIDHIVRKGMDPAVDSYSGFFDNGHQNPSGLADYLRSQGVTDVHIVGLAADYCVKFTTLDAVSEGFNTTLIADATRGVDLRLGDVERAIEECRRASASIVSSGEILSDVLLLYRPVGEEELSLLEESGFSKWPPRLPDQSIFYPVTNEAYAEQITREWNATSGGAGYVTRFAVLRDFVSKYPRKIVGGRVHEELWIPAEDLEELNANIVGPIEVITRIEPKP